jgi:hypothetical protein
MQTWRELRRFEVKGTGKESGRQRKRVYEEPDEDAARRRAEAEGTAIESVTDLGVIPPTEPQMAYAKGVGITVPEGASATDVSMLLTNYEEEAEPASESDFKLARDFGLKPPSQYMSRKTLAGFIHESLKPDQFVQWYLYLVFIRRANKAAKARIRSPLDPEIVRLARELKADPKAAASIQKRIQGGMGLDGVAAENTYAYREAVRILTPFMDPSKEPRVAAAKPAARGSAAPPRKSKAKASKQNPTLWGAVILVLIFLWIFL